MHHRRSKLALFLVVQTLAVGTMILLLRAGRALHCGPGGCEGATPQSVVLPVFAILGELVLLAQALRVRGPVWKTLAGLGILSLIVALFASGAGANDRVAPVAPIVAGWHLLVGFLLLGVGAGAGIWELETRLRRTDDSGGDDRDSSAMWPLD